MDGIFIVGHLNQVLYYECNAELRKKFVELGREHGLIQENSEEDSSTLDSNIILQILNPILASQKMMFSQFDNNYSILVGKEDFNIAYEEYFGNMFLRISTINSSQVQKEILQSSVVFSRMICGPDLTMMKDLTNGKAEKIKDTILSWTQNYLDNYCIMLGACRTLLMRQDKYNSITSELKEEMKSVTEWIGQKVNLILLHRDQIVCLYSTQQAVNMAPVDVSNLCHLANGISKMPNEMVSFNVYLNGSQTYECIPNTAYVMNYADLNMKLIVSVEADNVDIAKSIYKALTFINKVYNFNLRLDGDNVKAVIDKADMYVKQVIDSLKTSKSSLDALVKILERQWQGMRKKFAELSKISYKEVLNNLDAGLPLLAESLLQIFKAIYPETTTSREVVTESVEKLRIWFTETMAEKLKSYKTIHFDDSKFDHSNVFVQSYMEEFPGLIHFIFINRTTGRIISPDLVPGKTIIDLKTIRNYIQMSKKYSTKGIMSNIWKSATYSFSYFMWYEDSNGSYLKAKDVLKSSANQVKQQHTMKDGNCLATTFNDLTEELNSHSNYYQKFTETFFTKQEIAHGFELFLFHLAFVSPSIALEQSRRIAVTINDILGSSDNHWELL